MDDILSNLISLAALAVAAGAFAVARRNANAADTSAIEAGRSADAAKDSAESARRSAESAAVVARTEIEREHRDLRPVPPADMTAALTYTYNARTGTQDRFLEFTPFRTYRCDGVAVHGDARSPLTLPLVIEGGRLVRVFLDSDQETAVEAVNIRFWPPVEGDGGEWWSCGCDRPQHGGEAHWVWSLDIIDRPGPFRLRYIDS